LILRLLLLITRLLELSPLLLILRLLLLITCGPTIRLDQPPLLSHLIRQEMMLTLLILRLITSLLPRISALLLLSTVLSSLLLSSLLLT
jgi:hypothetical protein